VSTDRSTDTDTKLKEIIAAQEEIFVRRQPGSHRLAEQARQHLAGGVTSSWQITVLPMLGDYYTNQLMSGAASTAMIGNLIQGQLGTPGLEGQGAVLSLVLLLVLLVPMIYYVVSTNRSSQVAS
jgi:hypothetical protein